MEAPLPEGMVPLIDDGNQKDFDALMDLAPPATKRMLAWRMAPYGTTSPYDEPTQPFAGKPAVVVSSRGNQYGPGTPNPDDDHALPALRKILGEALGMQVTVVTAELTLSTRVPALASLRDRAEAGRRQAERTLDDLAVKLG
jgi:FMN-dependent NADH-azoreductase